MGGGDTLKEKQYILSLSYGKDSLACLEAIKLLGLPLDRIIHAEVWATDTIPADLPPMVDFKKKADRIIKERYGIAVEHIAAVEREREFCHTKIYSTESLKQVRDVAQSMASRLKTEHGVIQGSKPECLINLQKLTYEKLFYHVPSRRNQKNQGTIYGFPVSVKRGTWCQKLKTMCF